MLVSAAYVWVLEPPQDLKRGISTELKPAYEDLGSIQY